MAKAQPQAHSLRRRWQVTYPVAGKTSATESNRSALHSLNRLWLVRLRLRPKTETCATLLHAREEPDRLPRLD